MEKMKRKQCGEAGHKIAGQKKDRMAGSIQDSRTAYKLLLILETILNTSLYLSRRLRKPWMCKISRVPSLIDSCFL